MKYLAIVLMPTTKGLNSFKLSELLKHSLDALAKMRNSDDHACYQIQCANTLKDSYDFLQMLNVERDSTEYQQETIVNTALNYVVLAVSDDFSKFKPLENFTRNFHVYLPDNHIHAELNADSALNEQCLQSCEARMRSVVDGAHISKDEKAVVEATYAAALLKQAELELQWKAYNDCPMCSFEGPQLEAVFAKTPVLPRMSEPDSPVLTRTVSGVDLRAFYADSVTVAVPGAMFQRNDGRASAEQRDGRGKYDNNNNNNNNQPGMGK